METIPAEKADEGVVSATHISATASPSLCIPDHPSPNEAANLDLGYRIVMILMHYHLQSYHHLFVDNFFTSVHMASTCFTYLCGTTHAMRQEFPKVLSRAHFQKGDSVKWTSNDGIMVCKMAQQV